MKYALFVVILSLCGIAAADGFGTVELKIIPDKSISGTIRHSYELSCDEVKRACDTSSIIYEVTDLYFTYDGVPRVIEIERKPVALFGNAVVRRTK